MFFTWFGANAGASSMTTRPNGMSIYSVLSGSRGRQSDGFDALTMSATLGFGGSSRAVPAVAAKRVQAATRNVRRKVG